LTTIKKEFEKGLKCINVHVCGFVSVCDGKGVGAERTGIK